MSSIEYSSWNCAYGLLTECLWFFQPIQAKWSGSEPYFSMCSRPAAPNICGAGGAFSHSRSSMSACMCLSIGFVRSVYFTPSDPFSIFSKPTPGTQSARPPLTYWHARYSAVDPVEQLLLTFMTGIPESPMPQTPHRGQVDSPEH